MSGASFAVVSQNTHPPYEARVRFFDSYEVAADAARAITKDLNRDTFVCQVLSSNYGTRQTQSEDS